MHACMRVLMLVAAVGAFHDLAAVRHAPRTRLAVSPVANHHPATKIGKGETLPNFTARRQLYTGPDQVGRVVPTKPAAAARSEANDLTEDGANSLAEIATSVAAATIVGTANYLRSNNFVDETDDRSEAEMVLESAKGGLTVLAGLAFFSNIAIGVAKATVTVGVVSPWVKVVGGIGALGACAQEDDEQKAARRARKAKEEAALQAASLPADAAAGGDEPTAEERAQRRAVRLPRFIAVGAVVGTALGATVGPAALRLVRSQVPRFALRFAGAPL